jgi:hypothetical protein
MLANNIVFNRLRNLRLIEKLLIQGLILATILICFQLWLDGARISFMSFMAPIGFVFYMLIAYLIQPISVGVFNIVLINLLYKTKGWQVGFWLNGVFLLLVFSTIRIVLQTTFNLTFNFVAVIVLVLLSFPFGCIARFSNGGWKKPIN